MNDFTWILVTLYYIAPFVFLGLRVYLIDEAPKRPVVEAVVRAAAFLWVITEIIHQQQSYSNHPALFLNPIWHDIPRRWLGALVLAGFAAFIPRAILKLPNKK